MLTIKPTTTFFLLLILCLFASAHLCAQTDLSKRLDFKVDGETLESALLRLSKTSGVAIGFQGALLEKIKQPVRYQAHQETLADILNQLLASTDLKWNLSNGQIVIVSKFHPTRTLSGYVVKTDHKVLRNDVYLAEHIGAPFETSPRLRLQRLTHTFSEIQHTLERAPFLGLVGMAIV